jgi:hypothetical protein
MNNNKCRNNENEGPLKSLSKSDQSYGNLSNSDKISNTD